MEGSSFPIPDNVLSLIEEGEASDFNQESSSQESLSASSSPSSVEDQLNLTNCLLVGIILFIGIFFGAFCMSHLFNRIRKD